MDMTEKYVEERMGLPREFPSFKLFWCLAFVYASLLALMFQKLVLPLLPDMHADFGLLKNDAFFFHTQAVAIAAQINAQGWSTWKLFPLNATGNVGLLSAIYAMFGPNPAFFIPINAAAHATGALLIYMIGSLIWRGRVGALGGLVAAILFILFPSALQWYGQNHKDSFAIAGLLLMLYAWMHTLSGGGQTLKQFLLMLLVALSGALLLTMVRPYMVIVASVAFALPWVALALWSVVAKRLALDRLILIQTLLLLGVIAGVASLSTTIKAPSSANAFGDYGASSVSTAAPPALGTTASPPALGNTALPSAGGSRTWDSKTTSVIPRQLIQATERASKLRADFVAFSKGISAGSSIDHDVVPSDFWQVVAYMPRALAIGLFAPFPSTWADRVSAPRLVSAIETSVWYLFFIGVAILIYRRPSRALFSALAFAVFIIAILSYVQPNVGTLYRQRFGLWMFVLLCGAVGWASIVLPFFGRSVPHDADRPQLIRAPQVAMRSPAAIASSGSIVIMITFLCFLGFMARDILMASTVGINSKLDAFFSASMIPMFFVTFLSMPLADALMLPFLKAKAQEIEVTARNILWLATTVLGISTILLAIFAEAAVGLVLKGLDANELAEAVGMLRLFSPIVLLSAWTVIGNAVLNALHRTRQAAVAQLVVPTITLAAIVLLPREVVIQAALGGMLAGTFVNVLLVMQYTKRAGILLWPTKPKSFGALLSFTKSYGLLATAALFTAGLTLMNFIFAGTVGAGTASAWALSSKIVLLFNGLASVGIGAVLLPHFGRLIVNNGFAKLRNHVYFLLVAGSWIGGAVALAIFEFADPLANVLFSGNAASKTYIEDIANVIRTGALQLPILIAAAVIAKMAAVSGASSKALVAAMLCLAINLLVNLLLVSRLGVLGIALGSLAGTVISTAYLAIAMRSRCGFTMKEVAVIVIGWVGIGSACLALVFRSELIMTCAVLWLIALGLVQWRVAQTSLPMRPTPLTV